MPSLHSPDVTPTHYQLTITPNWSTNTFHGNVKISITTTTSPTRISLHALDLQLLQADLVPGTATDNTAVATTNDFTYNRSQTSVSFDFPDQPTNTAHWTIDITYTGVIHSNKMAGFYRNDADTILAMTQFEPMDARTVFPCLDEPPVKATFQFACVVDPKLTVLSNTSVLDSTKVADDLVRLFAWVIGEFEWIEAFTKPSVHLPTQITCRVYTSPSLAFQAKFALALAVKCLEIFAQLFGGQFPLRKLDQVAIPDFPAGSMENWGLIICQANYLLVDDASASIQEKAGVATTIAREIAHQWFGNLVTFTDWQELWLNEGFATWISMYVANQIFPDWEIWTYQFTAQDQSLAFTTDSLTSSHAVQPESNTAPDQAMDSISFIKGTSLIEMVSHWLGTKVFFKGVQLYMAKYQYANATPVQLWECLSEASNNMDVVQFMEIWSMQVGYPVVSIFAADVNPGLSRLHLKQARYLQSRDNQQDEDSDSTVWHVPLNLAVVDLSINEPSSVSNSAHNLTGQQPPEFVKLVSKDLFTTTHLDLNLDNPKARLWIINHNRAGLYRVCYPHAHLQKICIACQSRKVGVRNRYAIVDDVISLTRSGEIPITQMLDVLVGMIPYEVHFLIHQKCAHAITYLSTLGLALDSDTLANVRVLCKALFKPAYLHLGGLVGDCGVQERSQIALMTNLVGLVGQDETVIQHALTVFDTFIIDPASHGLDLVAAVFAISVASGDLTHWDKVSQVYANKTFGLELRYAALSALGHAQDPDLVKKTLAYAMDPECVQLADMAYIFSSLSANPVARRPLWDHFVEHWDIISEQQIGAHGGNLAACIDACSGLLVTEKELCEFQDFVASVETNETLLQQCPKIVSRASTHIQWVKKDGNLLSKWLSEWEKSQNASN